MKRFTRITALLLAVMMATLLFAGCGQATQDTASTQAAATVEQAASTPAAEAGTAPAAPATYPENGLPMDQKVTLKIGFFEGGYGRAYHDQMVKTFQEKFPNVTILTTASPDVSKLVETMTQAGNDEEMFDIFTGYNPYAANGLLEPLDDLYNHPMYDSPDKTVKDILMDGVYDNLTKEADGHYYKLPKATYIGGLFYDKNFFKQNGWNEDPKTYDEFLALCDSIKAKGITPMTFSGMYNYIGFTVWWHKAFEVAQLNGTLDTFEKNYRSYSAPFYNNPEMLEVYNRLYDMGKKGYFTKGLAALNHTQSQMLVLQHKVAMVSTGDWVETEMKSSGAVPEGFEWGYMAMPFGKSADDTIWINNGDSDSFVIWKAKADLNKAWAKEFLVWTLTGDSQKAIAELGGAMPIRKDFYENADNVAKLAGGQKAVSEYMKNHKVRLESNMKVMPKVGPSDSQADKLFVEGVSQVAEGKKDPTKLLNECETYFEKGLEEGKTLN